MISGLEVLVSFGPIGWLFFYMGCVLLATNGGLTHIWPILVA